MRDDPVAGVRYGPVILAPTLPPEEPPEDPPVPTHRMEADEFIAWAMERGGRWELEDGFIVRLAPERATHARVKHRTARMLEDAILRAGLPCEMFPDGMAVQVTPGFVYEPDALVRCGERLPADAVRLDDPVIVVEVHSPSTGNRDAFTKLVDYFRIPSVRHYLQVHPAKRVVVHHARAEGATVITTRILPDGPLRLDPPGLDLDVAAFFADL